MKKRGIIILLLISIFLILPFISSTQTEMRTYKIGSCMELIQLCGNCSYNNITSIIFPNSTRIILDVPMTKRGTEFNYTYCFPNATGEYLINGVGDLSGIDTVWAYVINLTPNGDIPTIPKLLFHYGSIFMLFLFFALAVLGIIYFEDYKGKFALYWVAHVLLIAITFMLWNGSTNLLTSAPFVISFFRIVFFFIMIASFPMVILSLAWIFYMHITCDEIMSMMDRGMDEDEAWSRVKSKRRRK